MPVSEAQKKATTKFESKNYKKICLRLPANEGKSALYDQIVIAADRAGQSLNSFILEAVKEKIEKI
jgi:predicted HicB family RNase H-like nuclease